MAKAYTPQVVINQRIAEYEARGFDKSYFVKHSDGTVTYYLACSQCQIDVINSVGCHKAGCPNDKSHSE